MAIEYSTNLMDLNLDIGLYIQHLQNGEHEGQEIENLEAIMKAIHKITYRMMGGVRE